MLIASIVIVRRGDPRVLWNHLWTYHGWWLTRACKFIDITVTFFPHIFLKTQLFEFRRQHRLWQWCRSSSCPFRWFLPLLLFEFLREWIPTRTLVICHFEWFESYEIFLVSVFSCDLLGLMMVRTFCEKGWVGQKWGTFANLASILKHTLSVSYWVLSVVGMWGIIRTDFVQLVDQVSVGLATKAFLADLREDERVLTLLLHEVCKLALVSLLNFLILTALSYVVNLFVCISLSCFISFSGEIQRHCCYLAFGDCRIQIFLKFWRFIQ